MKKNNWVFYFFIILFTIVISINLVWRFSPAKKQLQDSIEAKLAPVLGGSLELGNFSVGFGFVTFYDIVLGGPESKLVVHIDKVDIGYSMNKLLLNKMDVRQIIESITLSEPSLYLQTFKGQKKRAKMPDTLDVSKFIGIFKKLREIDRIFIKNGGIYWDKSIDKSSILTSNLDGILIINSDSTINVNLKGGLFDSPNQDVQLYGSINPVQNNWRLTAEVDSSRIIKGLPFLHGYSFMLKNAIASGVLEITNNSFDLMQSDIKGELLVTDLEATIFDQIVTAEDFSIVFDSLKMKLTDISGVAGGGDFILTGHLGDVFHPGAFFSVDIYNYAAKDVAISAPIMELLNWGKLQGHFDLSGSKSNFVITGKIYSSKLMYAIAPFYRSELDFTFKNKIWTFHSIKSNSIGLDHSGNGYIDFNTMTMKMDLSSYRHIRPDQLSIINRLNDKRMQFYTHMDGDFNTLTFTGRVDGAIADQEEMPLAAKVDFKIVDDFIKVQGIPEESMGIRLDAEVSNLWDEPYFDILEIKDVPFDSLSNISVVKWLSQQLKSDFYFSGPLNYPTAKVILTARESDRHFFTFEGNAINFIEPRFKFRGRFQTETKPDEINGNFVMTEFADHLQFKINSDELIQGHLTVPFSDTREMEGLVQLNQMILSKYIGRIDLLENSVEEGELNGRLEISGTTDNPTMVFKATGDNFIINQNGYYALKADGSFRNSELSFNEAWIKYNERPIFEADFAWDAQNDLLNAYFKGEQIESNFIAATIFNDKNLIRGDIKYEVEMSGDFERPFVSGFIYMRDGFLHDRAFKNLDIAFEDSIPPHATLTELNEHVFKILNVLYTDAKDYSVDGSGLIGVSPTGPIDFNLYVRGNILAELPFILEYFQNPNCIGELDVHIAGTRTNPSLTSGRIKVLTGSMEFLEVIPPLKNLRAEIILEENDPFVKINYLQGNLGERWVKISNVRSANQFHEKLRPLLLEALGLNFGVLTLETDQQGIPLSVPGLMQPGDIGYFSARGKTPEEKFYFAGPIESPFVRGAGTMFESRVTFPFLIPEEGELEEDSKLLEYLMNIDLDVFVDAGMSNRYFVDIPAVIGTVYMDLNIDEVSKGLHFTGKIIDESFRSEGEIESTRGRVEYLDLSFRVEKFGAVFNTVEIFPEVYGRAWTAVRDSTNFPRDIYLVLYALDPETNQEVARGRWEDFRFKLVSSDPTIGETQKNVLAYLGYSVENLGVKAGDVSLKLTENYLFRPLVRPLERKIERRFNLDYVRLQSNIASNLFYYGLSDRIKFSTQLSYNPQPANTGFDPALLLLQSSQVILGKYLLRDVYFTYTGQLVSIYDESKLGLNHTFGLEYRLMRNLLLEFEYDKLQFNPQYYSRDALQDWRIRLRHSFNF